MIDFESILWQFLNTRPADTIAGQGNLHEK